MAHTVRNTRDLRTAVRNGPYAWPGGYPLVLTMADGEDLCFDCARTEYRRILRAVKNQSSRDDWRAVGVDVHWEGPPKTCCNCGKAIPSAYGYNSFVLVLATEYRDDDGELVHGDAELLTFDDLDDLRTWARAHGPWTVTDGCAYVEDQIGIDIIAPAWADPSCTVHVRTLAPTAGHPVPSDWLTALA